LCFTALDIIRVNDILFLFAGGVQRMELD